LVQEPVIEKEEFPCFRIPSGLISKFPKTVRLLLAVSVVLTVPPMVSDLQELVLSTVGWLGPVKFASPKIASVVAFGTPNVQFEATDHFVLVIPFQLVWPNEFEVKKANKAAKKRSLVKSFILISEIVVSLNV
jgi:hypothetical protein